MRWDVDLSFSSLLQAAKVGVPGLKFPACFAQPKSLSYDAIQASEGSKARTLRKESPEAKTLVARSAKRGRCEMWTASELAGCGWLQNPILQFDMPFRESPLSEYSLDHALSVRVRVFRVCAHGGEEINIAHSLRLCSEGVESGASVGTRDLQSWIQQCMLAASLVLGLSRCHVFSTMLE